MESEHVPTRRELHKMIRNQGWLLVSVVLVLFLVSAALLRKGVLTWSDIVDVMEEASG